MLHKILFLKSIILFIKPKLLIIKTIVDEEFEINSINKSNLCSNSNNRASYMEYLGKPTETGTFISTS
jgi:hypothetical protein